MSCMDVNANVCNVQVAILDADNQVVSVLMIAEVLASKGQVGPVSLLETSSSFFWFYARQ